MEAVSSGEHLLDSIGEQGSWLVEPTNYASEGYQLLEGKESFFVKTPWLQE